MASSAVPSGNDGSESFGRNRRPRNRRIHTATASNPIRSVSSVISSQMPSPKDDSTVTKSWCHTASKVVKFEFTWTIHDFHSRPEKVGEMLESSTFAAGSNDELKLTLQIYPKGREDAENHFLFYLNLVSSSHKGTDLLVRYKVAVLNDKNEEAAYISSEKTFVLGSKCQNRRSNKLIELDYILKKSNGLLPDNNLTLVCEGAATVNTVNTLVLSGQHDTEIPQRSPKNLFSLFEKEFCDIILSVGGKDILAHEKILCRDSMVFTNMIVKCKIEKIKQNGLIRVVITDLKYEVLLEMLRFIYTKSSPYIDTMAEDLLEAAEIYELSELKVMCETFLCSRLTVAHAADLLLLADTYHAEDLKAQVISFITKRAEEVMLTPTWKNLKDNHPFLIIEAFEAMTSSSSKSMKG